MELDIHSKGFRLTRTVEAHVARRVVFAFDRLRDRIVRVGVRFTDVNGPRHGVDKACTVAITLRGIPAAVRVTQRDADVLHAVDLAIHRAARTIVRELQRRRVALLDYVALLTPAVNAPVANLACSPPRRPSRSAARGRPAV